MVSGRFVDVPPSTPPPSPPAPIIAPYVPPPAPPAPPTPIPETPSITEYKSPNAGSTLYPLSQGLAESRLNTEIGNFAKLRDDYLKITVGAASSYVRTEISGISIVDFSKDGVVGISASGNDVYRYRLNAEAYVLAYTTYPATYFYSLATKTTALKWLQVDDAKYLNIGSPTAIYNYEIKYREYSIGSANTKRNGGEYSLPITASFNIPHSGMEVQLGNTRFSVENIRSDVVSITTGNTPAKIGLIGSTDAKFNNAAQSGKATGYTQDKSVTDVYSDNPFESLAKTQLQAELERVNPGWIAEGTSVKVSDNSHNCVGMSTNARLATGSDQSLTGTYKVNVGSVAYHYTSMVSAKFAHVRVDNYGLITGAQMKEVKDIKEQRITGFGVDNFYVMQPIRVNIDVYSELEQLDAILTDPTLEVEPPTSSEPIDFDGEVTGDTDAEVQSREGGLTKIGNFLKSPTFILILIGVGAIAILGVVLYVRFQARAATAVLR
ncbi:hypothetical protein [Candidatus Lokiarchaeum ossiferum]|uniref:hypothetical protein n=1 Tax=Candidatus Lokiarchaeum ossiferum TaxID=2951803 RepID=UPI00352F1683